MTCKLRFFADFCLALTASQTLIRGSLELMISPSAISDCLRTAAVACGHPQSAACMAEMGLPDHVRVLRLSGQSVDSHKSTATKRPFAAFTPDDWQQIQSMVDNGNWMQDIPRHRVLWLTDQGKPWMVIIKHTDQGEVFLVCYYRLHKRQVRELERRLGK